VRDSTQFVTSILEETIKTSKTKEELEFFAAEYQLIAELCTLAAACNLAGQDISGQPIWEVVKRKADKG
jgi:hypothetical protein